MANDNNKAIKELLKVIKNKVGRIEARQGVDSIRIDSIKDQQSVMNEKLDDLQAGMDELNKKADHIYEFAEEADKSAEVTRKRVSRIEKIPAIAHELNKPS